MRIRIGSVSLTLFQAAPVASGPDRRHHDRMMDRRARSRERPGSTGAGIVGLLAMLLAVVAGAVAPVSAASSLPAWTGGVNLYRPGVFTTQASWLYCTAADIQIIRNMVEGTGDHSATAQTTYFDWMRSRNKYDLPLSAGVDPAGWTAGMRHFVDDRYRLEASPSFDEGLRLAVERIRRTSLPVALAVSHGNHAWVLHGFTATADPAMTSAFEVTSVSVTGPLWGRQSKNGYDMKPNTELTVDQLRTYFTPWRYDPLPMTWDGTFVSIQPVPGPTEAAPTLTLLATPTLPAPAATPSLRPTAVETAPTSAATAPPSASPEPRAAAAGTHAAPSQGDGSAAAGAPGAPGTRPAGPDPGAAPIALLIAIAIVVAAFAAWAGRQGHGRTPEGSARADRSTGSR
jgi:hypothetical protein